MDEKRFPVSVDLGVPESAPAPEPPPAEVISVEEPSSG